MTPRHIVASVLFVTFSAAPVLADFTYEQTTTVTGGSLLSVMKFAGAFSKDSKKATQPVTETISIKGNRSIRKNAEAGTATITDVDQQTITTVDYTKRTYSVMTFEELKQQMAEMRERMRSKGQEQPSFDVKVNDTGKTKSINGTDTHEVVVTMIVSGSDAKSGTRGAMNVATDSWVAPGISGFGEARELRRNMAEKLGWEPGQNPLLSRPDVAPAMAEVYKNGSKLDGLPLVSNIKVGADIQAPASSTDSTNANQPPAQSAPSSDDSTAARLAGVFGRFGSHKKKDNGDADANSSGALIEMTTQVNSYNASPVDEALFQVPSGFMKIEPRRLDSKSK